MLQGRSSQGLPKPVLKAEESTEEGPRPRLYSREQGGVLCLDVPQEVVLTGSRSFLVTGAGRLRAVKLLAIADGMHRHFVPVAVPLGCETVPMVVTVLNPALMRPSVSVLMEPGHNVSMARGEIWECVKTHLIRRP